MDELWQLYDERGEPLAGKGDTKSNVFGKGLLHGAAHVWIWRNNNGITEVLLQKRAAGKPTWPNRYDISAAGHIDLGETPLVAALRETKEEINVTVAADGLRLFGVHRAHLQAESGAVENEFQWLYSLELASDTPFKLQTTEVAAMVWLPLSQFERGCLGEQYVPHGQLYYDTVIAAIAAASGVVH